MAHRLTTTNGRVEMAYTGEVPWTKLGVQVEGMQSARMMLEHASMTWRVIMEPVYFKDGTEVPGKRALLREDSRGFFDIASDHYMPIQNVENADTMDALIANGATMETIGSLDDGKRCWALARIPGNFDVVKGDEIKPYVLMAWGHDGKHGVAGKLTPVRVVCNNTLQAAMGYGKWKENSDFFIRHSKNASVNIDAARDALGMVAKQIEDTTELFRALANRPLTQTESTDYVSQVFPYPASVRAESTEETLARLMGNPVGELEKAARDAMGRVDEVRGIIVRLMGEGKGAEYAPGTAWNAYNAVTEYTDHVYPVLQSGQVSTVKQQAVLFGATARVKDRALSLATTLLG